MCPGIPSCATGIGPSNRNRPDLSVSTAPLPAAESTPFAFDCQNDTLAPAIGLHVGDRTIPVGTWPVPILARSGIGPRSGPNSSLGVGAHWARGRAVALTVESDATIAPTTR